ncbi:unnamed protein product [Mycena citricolor]|uniref:Uncharacterized protein n=1 Tax=Mycena citricolor TaxID=2018698 RepID=A0AAD2HW02_9AGAR|nr:unnamed protein product [Mycena citricolor]
MTEATGPSLAIRHLVSCLMLRSGSRIVSILTQIRSSKRSGQLFRLETVFYCAPSLCACNMDCIAQSPKHSETGHIQLKYADFSVTREMITLRLIPFMITAAFRRDHWILPLRPSRHTSRLPD